MSPGDWMQQFTDVIDTLTSSDSYRKKLREKHEKYGAFRSGEGTREQILQSTQDHEEKEYLESLISNKAIAYDKALQKKLHSHYISTFDNRVLNKENSEKFVFSALSLASTD